jgi:hypothetical protein
MIPEITDNDPYDPEPADGDIQTECSSNYLYAQSIAAVTKIICRSLGQYRYCLIIQNIQ